MRPRLVLDETVEALAPSEGAALHRLLTELYPLPRSITGDGLRATVRRLGEVVPLVVDEVATGTEVFDWVIPDEWSLDEAYIEDAQGRRIVDARASNLHVVNYSDPVDTTMTLAELGPHLHSLPEHPDWVPYRTSYYVRDWGFCIADSVRRRMPEGPYRVVIRSRLVPGSLTLAEYLHSGASEEEILIFAHDCHPSLANDNLSGVVVAAHLAAFLRHRATRYSYRFVFAPTTIGSIAWLARNQARLSRIRHGLVLSILGSDGPFHYKNSRSGTHPIDHAAWHVLQTDHVEARRLDYIPWGYDERQFCSPGINLPVGRLTRTPNGEFAEYHTSADNPDFVSATRLGEAWLTCLRIFEVLEGNRTMVNLRPFGEPQLGRHGLYRTTGGHRQVPERQLALLWVLNQSDGSNSLLEIAERAGLPFRLIDRAATDLEAAGLLCLREAGGEPATS